DLPLGLAGPKTAVLGDAPLLCEAVRAKGDQIVLPVPGAMHPSRAAIIPSGVWRILNRLDMNRLPSSQRYRRHVDRWKRYEKPLPGHRVQIDVKFIAPLPRSRIS